MDEGNSLGDMDALEDHCHRLSPSCCTPGRSGKAYLKVASHETRQQNQMMPWRQLYMGGDIESHTSSTV